MFDVYDVSGICFTPDTSYISNTVFQKEDGVHRNAHIIHQKLLGEFNFAPYQLNMYHALHGNVMDSVDFLESFWSY